MGSSPTTSCWIGLKISGPIDLDLMNNFIHSKLSLNALVSEMNQKLHFTLCTIFSHGGHLGSRAGSSDIFFKLNTLMMIVDKFG